MAANYGTSSFGQEQKNRITLKGSTAIVTEFFGALDNEFILYERAFRDDHFCAGADWLYSCLSSLQATL